MKQKILNNFNIVKLFKRSLLGLLVIGLTACGGGSIFSDAGMTISPIHSLVVSEDETSITFTVALNSVPSSAITLDLSSNDLTEGTISPLAISFDESNWDIEQTVTITGVDDDIADGNQSFIIVTSPLVSDDANYNGINPPDVSVINTDNDAAAITVTPATLLVNETGNNSSANFSVILNTEPQAAVNINVTSTDITEALLSVNDEAPLESLNLEFNTNDWNSPKNVTVHGQEDNAVDGNQAIVIRLANTSSDDQAYNDLSVDDISTTVTDNNIAAVTISSANGLSTTEDGGQASFTAFLNTQPSADVSFDMSSSNINEGTIDKNSLTFTPANYAAQQIVTITGVDDSDMDGTQSYTIKLDKIDSEDDAYRGLDPTDIIVQNFDNEFGISVNPIADLSTTELGSTTIFNVVLNGQPTANVSISVSSGNPAEGLMKGGNSPNILVDSLILTFTVDDWSTVQRVTIVGQDDDIADGNQAYTIITAVASSSDSRYANINPDDISVTNFDNDVPDISISKSEQLTTSEDGDSISFNVALNSEPLSDVVLDVQSADITEGLVLGGNSPVTPVEKIVVTFTPDDWLTSQSVVILGQDDDIVDRDQVYNVNVSVLSSLDDRYAALGQITVLITNSDNDEPSEEVRIIINSADLVTTEAGGTAAFSIVLNSKPNADVVIRVTSNSPNEGLLYTAISGSPTATIEILFSTENWNLPQTIAIVGQPDEEEDGNKEFAIDLLVDDSSTLDTTGYASLAIDGVDVINDDVSSLSLNCNNEDFPIVNITEVDLPYTAVMCNVKPRVYSVNNLKPNTFYLITFTENEFGNLFAVAASGDNFECIVYKTESETTVCSVLTSEEGNLSIFVREYTVSDNGTFVVSIEENNELPLEGARNNPLVLDASSLGFIENGEAGLQSSYYQLTNLLPNTNYLIKVPVQLSPPVKLRVYGDEGFLELQCSNYPENQSPEAGCVAKSTNTGNLWVSVNKSFGNELAKYQIRVEQYSGILSEGEKDEPKDILFVAPSADYPGGVSAYGTSYYRISGLNAGELYIIAMTHSSGNLAAYIFENEISHSSDCSIYGNRNCLIAANENGELLVNVLNRDPSSENENFDFEISPYMGLLSEGTEELPINLESVSDSASYLGNVGRLGNYYQITGLDPDTFYVINVTGENNFISLVVDHKIGDMRSNRCLSYYYSCFVKSDYFGRLLITISGSSTEDDTTYTLQVNRYNGVSSEGSKSLPLNLMFDESVFPYTGTTSPSSSYYQISGLAQNTLYIIGLNGSTDALDLGVYSTPFKYQECYSRTSGLNDESCTARSDAFGKLWVKVDASGADAGEIFDLTVALYDGATSEGSEDSPMDLAFDESDFPHSGSASPRDSYYKVSGLIENTLYLVGVSNLTGELDLSVYTTPFNYPTECLSRGFGLNDVGCLARSDAFGNLWMKIDTLSTIVGATFDLTIALYDGPASEGSEDSSIDLMFDESDFPHSGSVSPRGSYYKISGLIENTLYRVGVSNLTNGLGLNVYATPFNYPTECSSSSFQWNAELNDIDCVARSDASGNLWVKIYISSSTVGATFDLTVALYDGAASEGSEDSPMDLVFGESDFLHSGSVSPRGSFYKVSGLIENTLYVIGTSEFSLNVYATPFNYPVECSSISEIVCLAKSDASGNLWVKIDAPSSTIGGTFNLMIALYDGAASEGSKDSPMGLTFGESSFSHSGSVSPKGSYYKISGLVENTLYIVGASNLAGEAGEFGLSVYARPFNYPTECLSRSFGLSDIGCLARSDAFGNLWVNIDISSSTAGATFDLTVALYDGPVSEGNEDSPTDLTFDESDFPYSGSASPRDSYYKISGLIENTLYIVGASNLTGALSLYVYATPFNYPIECASINFQWNNDLNDKSCFARSDAAGNLWVNIDISFSTVGATFDLTVALYDGPVSEGNEGSPTDLTFDESNFPYSGSASPRDSYYKVSGLTENTLYVIGASNLTGELSLNVYRTSFNYPIECSSRNFGLNDENCLARSDADGNLWVKINILSSIAGATFDLTIALYEGTASEGSRDSPMDLMFGESDFPHSGGASPRDSYYKISGLIENTLYRIGVSNLTSELSLSVYTTSSYYVTECSSRNSALNDESCVARPDASGNLWVKIDALFSTAGVTFDLTIDLYEGALFEGSRVSPLNLMFNESGFLYTGSVNSESSYYKISGLAENTLYIIGASNLTNALSLNVYATRFNFPTECSSRNFGLNDESCPARSDASGNLWVKIDASFPTGGATFDLTVVLYGGPSSEGRRDSPMDLAYDESDLPHLGSVSPKNSYYKISGLIENTLYTIDASNLTGELSLSV